MTTLTVKTTNDFNTDTAFVFNQSQIILQNKTNWAVKDSVTGEKYIFFGSDFTYNSSGLITSGLVSKVSRYDKAGQVIVTAQFSEAYDVAKQGYPTKYSDLLLGNDSIIGGNGNDILSGGNGAYSSIPHLINTGAGLADGQIDYNYSFTNLTGTATGFSGYAKTAVGYGWPIDSWTWITDNSSSDWLIPTENRLGSYADNYVNGDYKYSLQFDLTGYDPNTASFSGRFSADNSAVIKLNGIIIGTAPDYFRFYNFSANHGFISGINTLDFIVTNYQGGGNNPTGLRVEFTDSKIASFTNDTFKGGLGNDTYIIDSTGDKVTENTNAGNDTVQSSINYTLPLPNNVENLVLTGTQAINGLGNSANNTITGNDANNMLVGFAGNDILDGGLGDDNLIGGNGNDILNGGAGEDTVVYNDTPETFESNYSFEYKNNNWTIRDKNLSNGNDGTDVLTGIEHIQVADEMGNFYGDSLQSKIPSTNSYIKALNINNYWKSNQITYWFDSHTENITTKVDTSKTMSNSATESWTGQDATKTAIRHALDLYSAITPLTFTEAKSAAEATFHFNLVSRDWMNEFTGNTKLYAMMQLPQPFTDSKWTDTTGTMILVQKDNWTDGSNSFYTLIHELGHGLGLKHPFDSGSVFDGVINTGGSNYSLGKFNLNQDINTVMSYNFESTGFSNGMGLSLVNPSIENYGTSQTPMALDIAALQSLYGKNTNFNNGDTIYTLIDTNDIGTGYQCIWDTGGIDSIQYNGSGDATIDLRPATIDVDNKTAISKNTGGYVSRVTDSGLWDTKGTGIAGGFTIAHGVDIENAIGGSGNDKINGNDLNNILDGYGGTDTLTGFVGNDTYRVDNTKDRIIEQNAFDGIDTVESSVSWTLGSNLENLFLSGSKTINATGNETANIIVGNDANNKITGGAGSDTLTGNLGKDTFIFNNETDSPVGIFHDVITDFVVGTDKIDVSAIDANPDAWFDHSFTFMKDQPIDNVGELRFADGILSGNTKGDLNPEFEIALTGVNNLQASDINL